MGCMSAIEAVIEDEPRFGQLVATITTIWTMIIVTAGTLMVVYRDYFSGLFF